MQLSQTQYQLLTCRADWALFGGAAGGGKTHALTLDPLRHLQGPTANPGYRGAIFRRTFPELTQSGGLLDHCKSMYLPLGAIYNHTSAEFRFPSGAKISMETLQYEKDLIGFQGAQFDGLYIDEAASFPLKYIQFLWGRCRSKSGIRPTLRMSANPDNDSFLFKLVYWWLDPVTGYPDHSKSGVVRHFRIEGENIVWYDEAQHDPETGDPLTNTFTFIPSRLDDNKALLDSDPTYRTRLMNLPDNERERFLNGCWLASSRTDTEWPRHLFMDLYVTEDQYPVPQHREVVRMFAVDPSKGRHTHKGDYSAIVCLAHTGELGYVDADLKRRPPREIIEDLFAFCEQPHHRIRTGDLLGIEALQFQELFRDMIYLYAKDHQEFALSQYLLAGNPVIPVEDRLPKHMRIRRLGSWISGKKFRFLQNPGTTLLLQQLRNWDGQDRVGQHDDGPDALDMTTQLPRHLQEMFKR